MSVVTAVREAVCSHPDVQAVRAVGSRAEGRAHDLSDWDFAVETDEFPSVARDLPDLLSPLHPVAAQWDPYSSHACYLLVFPGPTKVDLLFPDERRKWSGAWKPSPLTLDAIDLHFWDWILWLEQKRRGGQDDVLEKGLRNMHELLLEPMGVIVRPRSVSEACDAYLSARSVLEERFGRAVPRELEHHVRPVLTGR